MIKTTIYIENQPLDLYNDVSTEFTYSIDDVKDFAARNTSFSKTIVIPGSANNNKLFGHVFELTSANPYNPLQDNVGTNFNASIAADCVILVDNIQVFKGVLRLIQINIDKGNIEYECVVFGELGGFANTIGNKLIENLDFSFYNHDWTAENIVNSWESTPGSGYFYPLIDYGKVSTNKKDWQYRAFRPAYYVREIMDKIITGAGYTYTSEFMNSVFFRRLIVPQNTKEMRQKSSNALLATPVVKSYAEAGIIDFTAITLGDFTYSGGIFTYNNLTTLTTDISFNVSGIIQTISPLFPTASIQVYRNTTLIGFVNFDVPTTPFSFSQAFTLTDITFNQGDQLYIDFVVNTSQYDITGGVLTLQSTAAEQLIAVNLGDEIDMNAHIPKGIFQRDFITSIVKMFNLYITEDTSQSRHLIIEPSIGYYERGEDALLAINDFNDLLIVEAGDVNLIVEPGESSYLDWTYKVDRSKPIVLKPMSELNGRYYEYKYKADNDFYNEQYQKKYELTYADRLVDTGFAFANDKQTAELIFSPTPLVGYNGEYKVYSTIVKLTNVGTPSQTEDATDHNIRIMQAKKMTGAPSWNLLNGATVLQSLTTWGYGGHLDDPKEPNSDLNFGAPRELYFTITGEQYPETNLFTGFWGDYIAEITDKDSKLLTCYVKLTDFDIFKLDFSRLIHIDGALFRLNKIIDYNGEDVTKCELLRVIETTYS